MFELILTTVDGPYDTAPVYPDDVWGARKTVRTGPGTPESPESITPDTDVPLTVSQMAQAFRSLGTPAKAEDVPLRVDPDDYPLF
jgi:hypothetical protein